MTGRIVISMNVDRLPVPGMVTAVIDTLARYRDNIDVSAADSNRGWILDGNDNVRATWRYEND